MEKQIDVKKERLKLILISATFGTVGLFSHFIPLSSAAIVFYRALLGGAFIVVMMKLSGIDIDIKSMRDNLIVLIFTGFFMALNWVLQFEAFKVSSVAIGTVCYNMMPIFLLIIASFVFNEKITLKSGLCILIATIGVILVSNVVNVGIKSNEVLGCVYGILGAVFYALIVTFNRKLSQITTHDKVIFQIAFSALIMAIYVGFIEKKSFFIDSNLPRNEIVMGIVCMLILSFLHTGFCYVHYFNAVSRLKAETVAILTYIDPVVALFLSYFVLKENMTALQFLGAVMILGSTLFNELSKTSKEIGIKQSFFESLLSKFKR
ncbi:MAG: EamA family transporter [Lachnospiraceae bacterium]|nr:EamA family transporter [Lachnospiraceae bacterium]